MPEIPAPADLYKAKRRTDDDLTAAVTSYLADPTPSPRTIAPGIRLDVAAAVQANERARIIMAGPGFSPAQRCTAVRTAILLARAA